jgi:hypothetical protein
MNMYSNRSLRVETQPMFPPRSPSMKSPNATPIKGFMKSTASSAGKLSPRTLNSSPDTKLEHADMVDKLMQDLIRFTRSR